MFESIHKLSLGVKQCIKQNFKFRRSIDKEIQLGKEIQYQIYTNEESGNKIARRNSYRYRYLISVFQFYIY